jgi:hypothetical protein
MNDLIDISKRPRNLPLPRHENAVQKEHNLAGFARTGCESLAGNAVRRPAWRRIGGSHATVWPLLRSMSHAIADSAASHLALLPNVLSHVRFGGK